jgi:Ca-activated chloride channel homolog
MYRTMFITFVLVVGIFVTGYAQPERKHIRHGNRIYLKADADTLHLDSTKYQDAELHYRKALETTPSNWSAAYNLGNALYRQQKLDEAAKHYQNITKTTTNKDELAKAYHNLGNTLLQQNQLDEAVEAYKNALRNNPADFETKYNLAWAQDKLKKQQNQNQDQQNQNQDDNKDQSKDKDKQEQNQNQEQQKQEQQQQQQQNQQQQQQKQQPQMSKEDAMRILEALQNDEKEVQDKVQKQKARPVRYSTEKDW